MCAWYTPVWAATAAVRKGAFRSIARVDQPRRARAVQDRCGAADTSDGDGCSGSDGDGCNGSHHDWRDGSRWCNCD